MRYRQYMVVGGYYDNKTNAGEFIQGLGTYDNFEQAFGKAYFYLKDAMYKGKGETITPIYKLEGSHRNRNQSASRNLYRLRLRAILRGGKRE